MDIRKVKKLIELLEESDINEIEIKEGEESVRISRGPSTVLAAPAPLAAPLAPVAAPVSPVAAPVAAAPAVDANAVLSPMVGVKVGDPICIIEAMKMMNQIEADRAGVIQAILVEDGQPVEFDQPLVTIV